MATRTLLVPTAGRVAQSAVESALKIQASSWERAARISRVRHPNLVRVLPLPGGAGFAPVFPGDRPPTLAAGLTLMPLEQLVHYLIDVLAGLGALHEELEGGRGFVHGGVCPQHVFIVDGIARLVPLVGRPAANSYGAPELLLDEVPDYRADLFSVGAMLWEAMTGAPPFPDRSPNGLRYQLELRPSELPDPAATPRDAPLGAIARRALSAPVLRYQNAIEFSNALGKALEQRASWTPRQLDFDRRAAAPTPPPLARSVTPFATVIALEPAREVENATDSTSPVPSPLVARDVSLSADVRLPARVPARRLWVAAGLAVMLIGFVGSSRPGSSRSASSAPGPRGLDGPVAAQPPATAAPVKRGASEDPVICAATCASSAAPAASGSVTRPSPGSASVPRRVLPRRAVSANDYGI
jgi:eukaryotic-like serine/threonine-protein kinase